MHQSENNHYNSGCLSQAAMGMNVFKKFFMQVGLEVTYIIDVEPIIYTLIIEIRFNLKFELNVYVRYWPMRVVSGVFY